MTITRRDHYDSRTSSSSSSSSSAMDKRIHDLRRRRNMMLCSFSWRYEKLKIELSAMSHDRNLLFHNRSGNGISDNSANFCLSSDTHWCAAFVLHLPTSKILRKAAQTQKAKKIAACEKKMQPRKHTKKNKGCVTMWPFAN